VNDPWLQGSIHRPLEYYASTKPLFLLRVNIPHTLQIPNSLQKPIEIPLDEATGLQNFGTNNNHTINYSFEHKSTEIIYKEFIIVLQSLEKDFATSNNKLHTEVCGNVVEQMNQQRTGIFYLQTSSPCNEVTATPRLDGGAREGASLIQTRWWTGHTQVD
jgi:hypothetical protein